MLKLRATFSKNPRIYPLIEGVVKAEGIELDVDQEDHGDTFAWLLDGGPSESVIPRWYRIGGIVQALAPKLLARVLARGGIGYRS